jgi:hypothetical protein
MIIKRFISRYISKIYLSYTVIKVIDKKSSAILTVTGIAKPNENFINFTRKTYVNA